MSRSTRALLALGAALIVLHARAAPCAADATWPREFQTEKGVLTLYQPQPERFESNLLQVRAAVSFLPKGQPAPVFGVIWFNGRVDTDRDAGTAMLRDIEVTNARWPESEREKEDEISAYLSSLMPRTGVPISLERLKASLSTAEQERSSVDGLKHDPPKFVVVEEPAELLLYDGEPRMLPVQDDAGHELAANSAFPVVRDKGSGKCYLSGGKLWYAADDPKGPWTSTQAPPAGVAKLVPKDTSATPAPAKPPRVVVATEPTVLIASDGPPSWKPVGKGALTYMGNTESDVVREVATGKVYVLVSGRWYVSPKELSGPWAVVRPDSLPAEFRYIPANSPLGPLRVSIAGTIEAQEAMLDAEVPQTAAIEKSKAKLEVKYDGEPQFKKIDGTGVEYAVNTPSQVLRVSGKYYACDNAVWFTSANATGPWAVADSIPSKEIGKIPPSEPVYNVTYVTVYESTPEVVYVGYTPGYVYAYSWYGVPVHGTGWYYPPYVSPHVHYARPVTFGTHAGYNPSRNLYGDAANRSRVAPASMQRTASLTKADRVAKGPNNLYATKSGTVHRQTSQGWQSRSQGSWQSSSQNMNRDAQARKRGSTTNYYGTGYSPVYPFSGGSRYRYGGRRR